MRVHCLSCFQVSIITGCAGLLLVASAPAAQTSGLLRLEQIQFSHSGPVQFQFNDYGTGATNYVVQFSSGPETNNWLVDSNAVITAQGGGAYTVRIEETLAPQGFYRVSGLGGANEGRVITFATTAFQVVEGGSVNTTLVLSQPFQGWIYYTVSGTAASADYQVLSGSNFVSGTTLTIPVSLTDNDQIGQLKYLVLRLQAGPGYTFGLNPSATITILENDAAWKGTFTTQNAALGFTLVIHDLNGFYLATLQGDGSGFFPTNEIPAAITYTPYSFAVTAGAVPVAAGATLLNTPASMTLSLHAMNGVPNQNVSTNQIQGSGELIVQYAGQPHLKTTSPGTFLLLKPPIAPSTNLVQLTAAP